MHDIIRDPQEIEAAELAETAFDRSSAYHWNGAPVIWSERHHWLWLCIVRALDVTQEQDALAAMWVGGLRKVDEVKSMERAWRGSREKLLDEVSEFCGEFAFDAPETKEAIRVARDIFKDIRASENEVDPVENSGDGKGGEPKK